MTETSSQIVGRLGELAVERELLKRGWVAGNFNASLANAIAFDLFAVRGARRICLRVKTTSGTSVQYSAKKDGTIFRNLQPNDDGDFVAIVLTKAGEIKDFYILPTQTVEAQLITSNAEWHKHLKRDGTPRKVTLHRALEFSGKETGAPHRGMHIKWEQYRNAWDLLC